MHISSNLSHWVCVFMGLFLIMTGVTSHASRQAAGIATPVHGADSGAALKRAVLIGIGLIAVGYGVSRVLA